MRRRPRSIRSSLPSLTVKAPPSLSLTTGAAAIAATCLGLAGFWSPPAIAQTAPTAAVGAQTGSADAADGPALWRLSDEDSDIYVFGSVHALPPELQWRDADLDAAFAKADVIYFEVPLDPVSQLQAQPLMTRIGLYPDDERLLERLSPEDRDRLRAVASELGLDMATLNRLRPWLAFILITQAVLAQIGGEADTGVEMVLGFEAMRDGKELRFFETIEQQLRFFADMPEADQIAILSVTLDQIDAAEQLYGELLGAWMSGAPAELERVLDQQTADMPEAFDDRILRDRNIAWVEELDALMDGAGTALIVVGAGHLVGPDSVLKMMADRGHPAERL